MTYTYDFLVQIFNHLEQRQGLRSAFYYVSNALPVWQKAYPDEVNVEKCLRTVWYFLERNEHLNIHDIATMRSAANKAARTESVKFQRHAISITSGVVPLSYGMIGGKLSAGYSARAVIQSMHHQKQLHHDIGELISLRMTDKTIDSSVPCGPIFLLLSMKETSCILLHESGMQFTVHSEVLKIMEKI